MKELSDFRNNGTIGAILDEYEKSINELKSVIYNVSNTELETIVDHLTKDIDCISIGSILRHVISAGYNYPIAIRKWKGEILDYRDKYVLADCHAYLMELDNMFLFNEQLFTDYPNLPLEEQENSLKIHTRWGQTYDVDQLFEHAIVHVLKHRRQIEKFRILLRTK